MARGSLRRYDVQARYAIILALVSIVPFLASAGLAIRNYSSDISNIIYMRGTKWLPVFLGSLALAMLLSALGFVLGWSSAGQRRNEKSSWSWMAFFIGGGVLTLSFVLLVAFMMLRLVQAPPA